ncbi:MAG: hypothetical protein L3K14_00255 [Thermoplasmata archaeon]|nr:hypothetical protein [Thermoplasmata archaeon]
MQQLMSGGKELSEELELRMQALENALGERLASLDRDARARRAAPLVVEAGRALRSGRFAAAHQFLEQAKFLMGHWTLRPTNYD